MALTPEQIAAEINDLGTNLPERLADVLQQAADLAIEQVKNNMNFQQNSPDGVRATVAAFVDESTMTLGISMPEHGYFQNFGVKGTEDKGTTQVGVDEATATAFRAAPGSTFAFGTGNYARGGKPWGAYYSGITAQQFLVMNDFIDQVAEYVNQNLELE